MSSTQDACGRLSSEEEYNQVKNTHNTPCLNIEDEFHDACSLTDFEVNLKESGDDIFQDASPNAKSGELVDDEPVNIRAELESKLSPAELNDRKMKAISLKEKGNSEFKAGEFANAMHLYSEALVVCPIVFSSERSKMFANRAACHTQLGCREKAIADCDEAIKLDPVYVRCLLRRADLRESVDRLTEALEDYQKVLQLDPGNARARAASALLPEKITVQQEKMKTEMMGQLKQLGNMVLKPFGLSTDNFKLTKDPNSGGYSVNFTQGG